MFDGRWRGRVDRGTQPLGAALHRWGLTANQLTAAGLVAGVGAAWAVATGHLLVGLVMFIAAALPDLFDGPLAKAAGTAGPRGAFFDSVSDRVTDSLILGGLAWYLDSSRGAHAALLPLAVLAASNLVSYERAKAESLGFDGRGGLMERAERVVVICLGLLFPILLVPALWLVLGASLVTAVHRFVKVWRQSEQRRPLPPMSSRWTVAAVEARWRARLAMREQSRHASRTSRGARAEAWRLRRRARQPRFGARSAVYGRDSTRP